MQISENDLICDFAETYRIYDYKILRPKQAAIFASGLRKDSRIMMRINDQKYSEEVYLLGRISDQISRLFEDDVPSILELLMRDYEDVENKKPTEEKEIESYESAEAFEAEMARRMRRN